MVKFELTEKDHNKLAALTLKLNKLMLYIAISPLTLKTDFRTLKAIGEMLVEIAERNLDVE